MQEQSPCFDKGALNLHLSSRLAKDFLIRIWILKPDKLAGVTQPIIIG